MKHVRITVVLVTIMSISWAALAQERSPSKEDILESKSRLKGKIKQWERNATLPFGLEMGMSHEDVARRLGVKARGFKDGTIKIKPKARYLGRTWSECELGFDANTLYVFTCHSRVSKKEWATFDPGAFEHALWREGPSPIERIHNFPSQKWTETILENPDTYLEMFRRGRISRYLWFSEGSLEYDYEYAYVGRRMRKKRIIKIYFCNSEYESKGIDYFCAEPTSYDVTSHIIDEGSYVREEFK